jgi:hypothetical protein
MWMVVFYINVAQGLPRGQRSQPCFEGNQEQISIAPSVCDNFDDRKFLAGKIYTCAEWNFNDGG